MLHKYLERNVLAHFLEKFFAVFFVKTKIFPGGYPIFFPCRQLLGQCQQQRHCNNNYRRGSNLFIVASEQLVVNRVENTKKYRVIGIIVPEIKKISQFTALRV